MDPASKLEIDLSKIPELQWAREKCSYGYCCMSQRYSSYTNVSLEGDINRNQLLDFEMNQVWDWDSAGSRWVLTSKTVQSEYGWPRTIISETDGMIYKIYENTIVKIDPNAPEPEEPGDTENPSLSGDTEDPSLSGDTENPALSGENVEEN